MPYHHYNTYQQLAVLKGNHIYNYLSYLLDPQSINKQDIYQHKVSHIKYIYNQKILSNF